MINNFGEIVAKRGRKLGRPTTILYVKMRTKNGVLSSFCQFLLLRIKNNEETALEMIEMKKKKKLKRV